MNFWYHSGLYCLWSKQHEHEHQENSRPFSSTAAFRNYLLHTFEANSQAYRFDEVSHLILSIALGVHGYNTCINCHWVSRCNFSIVTYPTKFSNHVRQIEHKIKQIEGHVPQGVEVQVLSSAQKQASQFRFREMCTNRGGVM